MDEGGRFASITEKKKAPRHTADALQIVGEKGGDKTKNLDAFLERFMMYCRSVLGKEGRKRGRDSPRVSMKSKEKGDV